MTVTAVVIGELNKTDNAEDDEVGYLSGEATRAGEDGIANRVRNQKEKECNDVSGQIPGVGGFSL